jgi:hypothetical protein
MDFRYRKQAYCQLKYLNGGQQMYNRLSGRCSLFKEALVTIGPLTLLDNLSSSLFLVYKLRRELLGNKQIDISVTSDCNGGVYNSRGLLL